MDFYFNQRYNGITIINNDRDARDLYAFICKFIWKDIKLIVCNSKILLELLKLVKLN